MDQNNNSAKVFLTVDTFSDQNDGNAANGLSLRDAILQAQVDPGREYVINLPEGTYNLNLEGNQDIRSQEEGDSTLGLFDNFVARTGDLDIETRVTIVGANPSNTIIDAGLLGDRIFDVRSGGFLSLEGVTLQGGTTVGTFTSGTTRDPDSFVGAGIRILLGGGGEIENTIITNNRVLGDGTELQADLFGAGVSNAGQLKIDNTSIIGNFSDSNGGGIFNIGDLEITNSSIVNNVSNVNYVTVNEVDGGGGIFNSREGTLLVRNSTISGNATTISGAGGTFFADSAGGGGILVDSGELTVINSTIVDNRSSIGSGVIVVAQEGDDGATGTTPAVIQNSIIANNTNTLNSDITFSSDIEGLINPNSSYNLIGNGNGVLFNGIENNIVGDAFNPIDPGVGPLQFIGNSITPVNPILSDSPAVDAGSSAIALQRTLNTAPLVEDQLGSARVVGDTVDIGSVEFDPSIGNLTPSGLFSDPLYRFQNNDLPGTYLYVNGEERQDILTNFSQFEEEGVAFNVSLSAGDGLIAFYRFQSDALPGTYLYVNQQERNQINNDDSSGFTEEGLAFYALPDDAGLGMDIYRFRNNNIPGTYIYVDGRERQNILNNFNDSFTEEGVSFEV